jgi:hypothetical protein
MTTFIASLTPGPAAAQIEVLSPSVFEQTGSAGAHLMSAITLRNPTTTAQGVRLYQEDYQFFADGRSLFEHPGTLSRSNAGWIRLSTSNLVLEPGQTAKVTLSTSVPVADSLAGTYWSLVLVEPIPAGARERSGETAPAHEGVALQTRVRHAIQVVTHIGHSGSHLIRFVEPQVTQSSDGHRAFRLELVNAGERAFRPEITLEVYGEDGPLVLTRKQGRGLVYPGTSILQSFDIDALAKGEYTFLLLADTSGPEVFAARFKLRL